jgi:hypothetical protein
MAAQKANILPSLMGKGKGAAPVQQQYVAAVPLQQRAFVAAQPQYVVAAQPQYVVAAQPQVQVRSVWRCSSPCIWCTNLLAKPTVHPDVNQLWLACRCKGSLY